jgi:hypothetical protein
MERKGELEERAVRCITKSHSQFVIYKIGEGGISNFSHLEINSVIVTTNFKFVVQNYNQDVYVL